MPVKQEGFATAEQRAEEAKKSAFHKIPFMKVEEGKPPVSIRFVSNEIFTFDMHGGIPTKTRPAEVAEASWAKIMFAVCQNSRAFQIHDPETGQPVDGEWDPGYGQCHIHKIMKGVPNPPFKGDKASPRTQTFGLAVLREPVRDPSTRSVIAFRDQMEEFKAEDGTVSRIPKLVIVQQSYSNFWSPLKAQMYLGSADLTHWEFAITREADNKYGFSARETGGFAPDSEDGKRYAQTLELTGFNLWGKLIEWSSPDWYARWFIEGATPEGGYGRQDAATEDTAAETASAGQPSPEAVGNFAEELRAARSGASA